MSSSSKSSSKTESARVSSGVQSTAGGDEPAEKTEESPSESKSGKEKKPDLGEAVVHYLNVKDGPYGSQQDYDDAVNQMVAALPDKLVPQSLSQEEEPRTPDEMAATAAEKEAKTARS